MATGIKSNESTEIIKTVKPDTRNRVSLPKSLVGEGITYHISVNSIGQIILDPQVTIPASELWLFENKEALVSVDRGMAETTVINRGSFAKYVTNAP